MAQSVTYRGICNQLLLHVFLAFNGLIRHQNPKKEKTRRQCRESINQAGRDLNSKLKKQEQQLERQQQQLNQAATGRDGDDEDSDNQDSDNDD